MHCNQSPLISIISPVYQVEKYLDKCIASVVNQTYTNLEIIIIDDGSTDNCPAICDAWKERDPRIKVIHQENGGLSHARNEGMKLATGEFIGFVDSDDWIEPNMYETLLDALLETDADISICDCCLETETSKFIPNQTGIPERKQYTPEEALKILFKGNGFIYNGVWQKLYRRTIISNNTFPEGKICEDGPWTIKALGNARLITCIDCILYHYYYRAESLSHNEQQILRRLNDALEMIELQVEYVRKYFPALNKYAIYRLQNYCCKKYIEFSFQFCHLDADSEIRHRLHQIFCQYQPIIIWNIKRYAGKTFEKVFPAPFSKPFVKE